MRRFYLFKRKRIWYIRLINPSTGKPISAKSSGTEDREKAEFIAQQWIYEGVPEGNTNDPRTAKEIFTIDEILNNLKSLDNLTSRDVKRFLNYFKACGFISSTRIEGNSEQTLIEFLKNFWTYDSSPYIQEKLSHGQGITRSHVKNMV